MCMLFLVYFFKLLANVFFIFLFFFALSVQFFKVLPGKFEADRDCTPMTMFSLLNDELFECLHDHNAAKPITSVDDLTRSLLFSPAISLFVSFFLSLFLSPHSLFLFLSLSLRAVTVFHAHIYCVTISLLLFFFCYTNKFFCASIFLTLCQYFNCKKLFIQLLTSRKKTTFFWGVWLLFFFFWPSQ